MLTDRPDEQWQAITDAVHRTDLSPAQLWTRYFALGGDAGLVDIEAYLHGLVTLPGSQRDILAHAVNERLDELVPPARVPYSRSRLQGRPDGPTLSALAALIDGMHLAPPQRLPAVVATAGDVLGLDVTIYLIDYDQHVLCPLLEAGSPRRESLAVDTTLAGRAFRLVQMTPARPEAGPRLWVPLLDGVERLGVLEVVPRDDTDLSDPGLHSQCRWLSLLTGHLTSIISQLGDGISAVRLLQPRTPASELIWELLPPLTAGTGTFVLAGMLEPTHEVGGDVFDYSLSDTTAWLAMFDAVGHTLDSGLIAAAAIAGYRSSRRQGHDLLDQANTIERTVVDHFSGGGAFVTGVLAEVDLATGRLRYLNAGHPKPMLLRSGKVVKRLGHDVHKPFGLGEGSFTVGEETLQPDDWLVLFTDGITEARDEGGLFFGEARLIDFLEREVSAGFTPPETVRRLVHSVLAHQHGRLQDDASVLLARWINKRELEL